jgi:hypothetical protein
MKVRKNERVVIALLLLIGSVSSCAMRKTVGMQEVTIGQTLTFNHLERKHYEILQPTEGEGCAKYIGLWPLPIFFVIAEDKYADIRNSTILLWGFGASGRAKNIAIFNAIEKVPEADAIIFPRYYEETYSFLPWYVKTCVTVKGKAIKIKEDKKRE